MKKLLLLLTLMICGFQIMAGYNLLQVRLTNQDNGHYDESAIRFMQGATAGFDSNYDAWKIMSPNLNVPAIFTHNANDDKMAINSCNLLVIDTSIALYIKTQLDADYNFNFFNLLLEDEAELYLEDTELGIMYDLTQQTEVNFYMPANTGEEYRFVLHFSFPVNTEAAPITCFGMGDGQIVISDEGNNSITYELFDINGELVVQESNVANEIVLSGVKAGEYTLNVTTYGNTEEFKINIIEPEPITGSFESVDTAELFQSVTVQFTADVAQYDEINWDFGDGGTSKVLNPSHTYYQAGSYDVSMTVSLGDCFESFKETVTIIEGANGIIQLNKNELTVYATRNEIIVRGMTGKQSNQIMLYDMNGKQILEENNMSGSQRVLCSIDPGVYLVQLIQDGVAQTQRLFIGE